MRRPPVRHRRSPRPPATGACTIMCSAWAWKSQRLCRSTADPFRGGSFPEYSARLRSPDPPVHAQKARTHAQAYGLVSFAWHGLLVVVVFLFLGTNSTKLMPVGSSAGAAA